MTCSKPFAPFQTSFTGNIMVMDKQNAECSQFFGPLGVCVRLHYYSYEVKFVLERGVARLWEVARFSFLLPCN